MTSLRLAAVQASADRGVAITAVTGFGCGVALALHGIGSANLPLTMAGGLAAGIALLVLVAADWLDGLTCTALALPLPALASIGALRLSAAAPVTALVVLAWVLRRGMLGGPLWLGSLPRRATAALFGVYCAAAALGQHPLSSARELVNFSLLLAFLVVATDTLARHPARQNALVALLVSIAAACGLLAILQTLGMIPSEFPRWDTPFNRAALGFGQPNALGFFLAVVLPLAVHRMIIARGPTDRILTRIAVGLISLGLVGTFSRGSWLALLLGSSALLFVSDRRRLLRLWLGIIIIAVVVDLGSGGMIRDTVRRTTLSDASIAQRSLLMLAGVSMFAEHPLIGVGPGGFADELNRVGAEIAGLSEIQPTPHNAYIQMAAETGVIGLAAFLFFLGAALKALMRGVRQVRPDDPEALSLRRALLWSFATACCAGLTEWQFAHGVGEAILLILALGFAANSAAPELSRGSFGIQPAEYFRAGLPGRSPG